jgi:ribosomal protein L14
MSIGEPVPEFSFFVKGSSCVVKPSRNKYNIKSVIVRVLLVRSNQQECNPNQSNVRFLMNAGLTIKIRS